MGTAGANEELGIHKHKTTICNSSLCNNVILYDNNVIYHIE